MGVGGVGNYNYTNYADYKKPKTKATTEAEEATKAASAEKSAETEETTEKSTTPAKQAESYKPDMDKIKSMKSDLRNNIAAFKQMVYSNVKTQGNNSNDALNKLLEISGTSKEDAMKAISDDGEWGVDATANRILDFAKALSGGDPAKISELRDAVNKGFAAAGKVWGGDLPEISNQTLKKVMEGFDEWEKSSSADKTNVK